VIHVSNPYMFIKSPSSKQYDVRFSRFDSDGEDPTHGDSLDVWHPD